MYYPKMGKKSISKFRDTRLDEVYASLVASMVTRYTVTLRQFSQTDNEETRYRRFINNPKVNPKLLIAQQWQGGQTDFTGRHVLVINDTSTISFAPRADRTDLGRVGHNTTKRGFDIHPSIMVDAANSRLYGVGAIEVQKIELIQTAKEKAERAQTQKDRGNLPFEQKKRYKWFSSPQQAIANCTGAEKYTLIGDRESDIYDLIARTLEQNWELIYRSKTNRRIEEQLGAKKLRDLLDKWSIEHTFDLALAATKKRSAHTATMDLKFGSLTLTRPQYTDSTMPKSIDLQVLEVKERQTSVVGKEKAVHWILLTSHPVHTTEQALQIIKWYQWRWIIEELFRTLKSKGMNIESSQVETFHALSNLAAIGLIAAAQVMQLVRARDGQTEQKMEDAFFETEQQCLRKLNIRMQGQSDKLKNPYPPDSLAFATWVIARLGGWSGYRSRKPAGPITIIKGLIRFHHTLEGYYMKL